MKSDIEKMIDKQVEDAKKQTEELFEKINDIIVKIYGDEEKK